MVITKQTFPVTVTDFQSDDALVAKLDFLNQPADVVTAKLRKSINSFDEDFRIFLENNVENDRKFIFDVYLQFDLSEGFPNLFNRFSKEQIFELQRDSCNDFLVHKVTDNKACFVFDKLTISRLFENIACQAFRASLSGKISLSVYVLELEIDIPLSELQQQESVHPKFIRFKKDMNILVADDFDYVHSL